MPILRLCAIALVLLLAACGDPAPPPAGQGTSQTGPRVLTMGDSILAWNSAGGASVADALEVRLGAPVTDRSVSGARVLAGSGILRRSIARQYLPGDWDWVVLNGGGNDLWLGCGCGACEGHLTQMVSRGGDAGEIPALVNRIRASGARVVYLGYMRTPGRASPVDHCDAPGDVLEARLIRMAARDPGVTFLSLRDLAPSGDLSFHAPDRIHPSRKGSAAIAARVAKVIARTP